MLECCCCTHWATVLAANSNCLAQSNPQELCSLSPAERSQRDQVSACYKCLLSRVNGHPCQTSWACSGGPVQTCQVVSWCVSAHTFYSSNPDPQHHARVWRSIFDEIQIQISCDIPHVTCTHFGHVSNRPPHVIFTCLGHTYKKTIHV